ncbi:MAG: hypothetical protein KF716_27515 [Anaerolineae bacterium]|nr:hypothetical protein [Anaerolineae bacterium]
MQNQTSIFTTGSTFLRVLLLGTIMLGWSASAPTPTLAQNQTRVDFIWVVLQTDSAPNAGTNSDIQILFKQTHGPSGPRIIIRNFVNRPWDENEAGRTETYTPRLEELQTNGAYMTVADFQNKSDICFQILGSDAWLLNSVWIIGRSGDNFMLLNSAIWPQNAWLSTKSSEGLNARNLYGQKCALTN